MSGFGTFIKNYAKGGFSPFSLVSALTGHSGLGVFSSLFNTMTGAGLNGAQKEANAFNADQAQKQMTFQQQMRDTQYQSAVQDMQKAGVNPALMYGSGANGNSAPSGAMATSVSPTNGDVVGLLGQIANLSLLRSQKRNIDADTKSKETGAKAAILNAWSNFRNSNSQERQAKVAEDEVAIKKMLADKKIEVDDSIISNLAENTAYIGELRSFVAKNYEILEKNATSLERQSIAAMRQADAAIQNAATNSELASYNTDLMYSQVLLNEIVRGEHKEILNKLPEKLRYEVENLQKQGVVLDKQGRLLNRQGNLASAMTVKAYVSTATDVAKTVASFIPGASASNSYGANIDLVGYGAYGSY